jgi:hypothetical protein
MSCVRQGISREHPAVGRPAFLMDPNIDDFTTIYPDIPYVGSASIGEIANIEIGFDDSVKTNARFQAKGGWRLRVPRWACDYSDITRLAFTSG